jgi:hypothetical protein
VARADLEYEFPKEHDPPYLKRQIIMVTAPGYKSVETTVFEELAPTTADRDEFTLSAFGLSEPPAQTNVSLRVAVTLFAVALLLILSGVYVRKRIASS